MIHRYANRVVALVSICMFLFASQPALCVNQPPVADAGPSRYAGDEPIVLDGTGSYDPDPGDTLTYQWTQVSGPAVALSDTDTATPSMTATLTGSVEIVELELTVTDNLQATSTDAVQVTIVSAMPPAVYRFRLENLESPVKSRPFDPNKPTFVYFGGGDCTSGGGWWSSEDWNTRANVFSTHYEPDATAGEETYYHYGNAMLVYLSSVAPDYDKPIQTAGYSTGGMPAIDVAIQMNSFQDPRYNVNRVTFLDRACRFYLPSTETYISNPVAGEPTLIVSYSAYDEFSLYIPPNLNREGVELYVYMIGGHSTPRYSYRSSIRTDSYAFDDPYNHGVTAGAFLSAAGGGRNYHIPPEVIGYYHYYWPALGAPILYYHQETWPGALPEPVTLVGPADEAVADATGVTLGSEPSEHAVVYQLLWGQDKSNLQVVYEQEGPFNIATGPLPSGQTFYWTVKVRDRYGATIFADPRKLIGFAGVEGDFNDDGQLDSADCAIIKSAVNASWNHASFILAADLDGDGAITCLDADAWLALYRAFLQNTSAPDPCGLQDATDTDGDGTSDLCDNCPGIVNADQQDLDGDGIGDTCDNCPLIANFNNQMDSDGDSIGDLCDDNDDNDDLLDRDDNCPRNANSDQTDSDGDNVGDACDNCPTIPNIDQANIDGDSMGDVCDDDVDGDGLLNSLDNCPIAHNPDQSDEDNDGVGDVCDTCPGTVAGVEVDPDGCGVLPIPGDFDADGDVDQKDFGFLQTCLGCTLCFEGFTEPPFGPDCFKASLDGNAAVDQDDLDIFRTCFSGPTVPGDAYCAD